MCFTRGDMVYKASRFPIEILSKGEPVKGLLDLRIPNNAPYEIGPDDGDDSDDGGKGRSSRRRRRKVPLLAPTRNWMELQLSLIMIW